MAASLRVIITGGGSGIGAATAHAVTERGGSVVVIGRRADQLAQVSRTTGGLAIPGDIRKLDEVPALIEQALTHMGGLDAVVNAAAVIRPDRIADADPEDWRAMFETNVLGLLAVTKACMQHLEPAHGTIVNISSTSGRRVGTEGTGTFSATKQAVNAISETLHQELAGSGLRVTTVMPGFVSTPLFEEVGERPIGAHLRHVAQEVGLDPMVIGRAIADVLWQPPGTEVRELAIVPTRRLHAPS